MTRRVTTNPPRVVELSHGKLRQRIEGKPVVRSIRPLVELSTGAAAERPDHAGSRRPGTRPNSWPWQFFGYSRELLPDARVYSDPSPETVIGASSWIAMFRDAGRLLRPTNHPALDNPLTIYRGALPLAVAVWPGPPGEPRPSSSAFDVNVPSVTPSSSRLPSGSMPCSACSTPAASTRSSWTHVPRSCRPTRLSRTPEGTEGSPVCKCARAVAGPRATPPSHISMSRDWR